MRLFSLSGVLLLLLCHLTIFAEDVVSATLQEGEQLTLSKRAQRNIASYEQTVQKAEQEYLQTILTAQRKLQRVLKREIDRLRLSERETRIVTQIVETESDEVRISVGRKSRHHAPTIEGVFAAALSASVTGRMGLPSISVGTHRSVSCCCCCRCLINTACFTSFEATE